MAERSVLGDVHRERAFAHGWPSSDDDELTALQPRRHLVHLDEARRNARDLARRMAQEIEPIDRLRQNLLQRDEAGAAARPALRDLKHALLGAIDDLGSRQAFGGVGARRNVAADLDELTDRKSVV